MKKSIQFFILVIYTLYFASTVSADTLVVGSVSEDPSEEMANFLPFTKHLATKLANYGITDGKVVIAKNLDEMRDMFAQGKVDLYIDSPISAYSVIKNNGGEFLLRRWKRGISEYHSVIFVKADSPFKNISDLLGRTLLFEEEFSSSGYLLPKLSLHNMGYSLQKKQTIKAPVIKDTIGYYFSNDDENTLLWVAKGLAAAGAMGSSKLSRLSSSTKQNFRILHHTVSIPRHVVTNRKGIDPGLLVQIRKLLLHMHESKEGNNVLYTFEKTEKFDSIPSQFTDQLSLFSTIMDKELSIR